jgi:predicted nucleic acid-binding protein
MARSRRPRRHRRVRETAAPGYPKGAAPSELTGVLLDSDVIIEILRGHAGPLQAAVALEQSGTPTFCTAISWAEVYAGVRPGEEEPTRAFFEARGEVALDGRIGRHAGAYLARYARSHGVEIADALIAGAATAGGLRLWTLNRKHYPMEDLRFFEPAQGR